MSEKGSELESEVVDDPVPRNPFRYFVNSLLDDPRQFTLQISVWFAAIYIYYIIADEFVRQSLLNLTPGRIQNIWQSGTDG